MATRATRPVREHRRVSRRPPPRCAIERVRPQLDAGRFPVKRVMGEAVAVSADVHADGHDVLRAELLYRRAGEAEWSRAPLRLAEPGLDRWEGSFRPDAPGRWEFSVEAWVDRYASWLEWTRRKAEAREDVRSELLEGAQLLRELSEEGALDAAAEALADASRLPEERLAEAAREDLIAAAATRPDDASVSRLERPLPVRVDRPKAVFSSWYEMFPRSAGKEPGRPATLREAEGRLDDIAGMGFDVLYLPPVHPIGHTNRKGRNNSADCRPGEPGSPWAIGSEEGGHDAVHPELGTLEDFRRFLRAARERGLEIALDFALQCSPDHPYAREHPEWFRRRPDGSIKYAENPPKKYQDIYPLDFECEAWRSLWEETRRLVLFWAAQGVRVFRVDNPHTKGYRFWEWLISEVQARHPDAIFLSEAFTRPRVMQHLAKLGFTQSYTYFTWRNTKAELSDYLGELCEGEPAEYLRPNFFANTPDILPTVLQTGGPAAFRMRLLLAATLSPSYGIYSGFELCESAALPGREEYLDSEKYEVKPRDWDRPGNIKDLIRRVNAIRRANPALQRLGPLRFLPADSESILFYLKSTPDLSNALLIAVNLDPHGAQTAWVSVPPEALGLPPGARYGVRDLLTGRSYEWGERNYVALDPAAGPGHVLLVEGRLR